MTPEDNLAAPQRADGSAPASTHAKAFRDLVTAAARAAVAADVDAAGARHLCGRLASSADLGKRWRDDALRAAEFVGVYRVHLQPRGSWQLLATDEAGALWWAGDNGDVIADLFATGGRSAALWTPRTTAAPRQAVRAGQARYGDQFAGVRVLALAAPARSLLVRSATAPAAALTASHLWMGSAPATADTITQLLEAAA